MFVEVWELRFYNGNRASWSKEKKYNYYKEYIEQHQSLLREPLCLKKLYNTSHHQLNISHDAASDLYAPGKKYHRYSRPGGSVFSGPLSIRPSRSSTDFHETQWRGAPWANFEPIQFWI